MPTWEEGRAAAGRAFTSIYYDIGTTYQRVLMHGPGIYQSQDFDLAFSAQTINPEYARMEHAYMAQEQEREHWNSITVDDYQPTDIDWQEYGQYVDEMRRVRPDLYDQQPEPQDLEPER